MWLRGRFAVLRIKSQAASFRDTSRFRHPIRRPQKGLRRLFRTASYRRFSSGILESYRVFQKPKANIMQVRNFLDNDDVKVIAEQGRVQSHRMAARFERWLLGCRGRVLRVRNERAPPSTRLHAERAERRHHAGGAQCSGRWATCRRPPGVKGVGDFVGKLARGAVTGESAVKPEYVGQGTLVLEPTWKHVLLLDNVQHMGGGNGRQRRVLLRLRLHHQT